MALIDENLDIYLNNLMPKVDGELGKLQQKSYEEGVPIIPNDVVRLISVLLSIKKPKKILEIGCAVGFSSSFMSSFLQDGGKVTTIERYPVMIEKAKANIKSLGLDNKIELIEGDANEVLKTLNDEYDVIFMDAGKGHYNHFLPHCLRLLNEDGIIVADNVLFRGMVASQELVKRRKITIVKRMREYLDLVTKDKDLITSVIPMGDGIAVTKRR